MSFVRANYPLFKILWHFKMRQCKRCHKYEHKLNANKLCDLCHENLKKTFKITYIHRPLSAIGLPVTSNIPDGVTSDKLDTTTSDLVMSDPSMVDRKKTRTLEERRMAAVLSENRRLEYFLIATLFLKSINHQGFSEIFS